MDIGRNDELTAHPGERIDLFRFQYRTCANQRLVAGTSLTARYQQAFQAMGCDVTAVAGDTAFQAGIRSIAHAVAN